MFHTLDSCSDEQYLVAGPVGYGDALLDVSLLEAESVGVQDVDEAIALAQSMLAAGEASGKQTTAFVTSMNEPIGSKSPCSSMRRLIGTNLQALRSHVSPGFLALSQGLLGTG